VGTSLFARGNSIASALANEFTEAVGDLYTSALIELGLILFLITFVIWLCPKSFCTSSPSARDADLAHP